MRTILIILLFLVVIIGLFDAELKLQININKILRPHMYKCPDKSNLMGLTERQIIGQKIARDSKVVICCLARNISDMIKQNKKRMEFIGEQFSDYKIVFFENDSTDNSRKLISDWRKENSSVVLLDCCNLGSCDCKLKYKDKHTDGAFSKERINKMALYRQQYLDYVVKKCSDYEYMLVVDIDLEGGVSIKGLFESLTYSDWTAIFPNGKTTAIGSFGQITTSYDGLPFVPANGSYHNKEGTFIDLVKTILYMTIICATTTRLIPVKSGFNGYGLYKIKDLADCSYQGDVKCEHINLSKSIHSKGLKQYINPNWSGYFYNEFPAGVVKIYQYINGK